MVNRYWVLGIGDWVSGTGDPSGFAFTGFIR